MMRPRSAGAHAIAAAFAMLFVASAGCSHANSPSGSGTPTPSPKPTAERYLIHGSGSAGRPVKVQDIVKGKAVYVLKATDVYYSTSSNKGRFLNNTIYFYKGSTVRLTLTAPTADLNRTSYDFVLTGGVRAKSALGVTLDCDVMAYNGYTQLLTATGNVRAVDAQGDVLTGDKAVADLDLQQIHMSGHVGIGR
jgi:LPS export ABC transporter protein LptC